MELLIVIVISIIAISLIIILLKWLIKGLVKMFPLLLGIGVVSFFVYAIIYATKYGITFGNITNFVLQVLYFGVALVVLFFVSAFFSEILKLIKLRWMTIPILFTLVVIQLALKPKGYVIPDTTSFWLATGSSITIALWACAQLFRINRNIGFNNQIDSNIMVYYASMGSAIGFLSMYLINFPNNLLHTNFYNAVYLNVLVYIALLISIYPLNKQVNIYVKVRRHIKQNGYCTMNDILSIPLSEEKDDEKSIYANEIVLKMKQHNFVKEIGIKNPIYIRPKVYKSILRELEAGKDVNSVVSVVQEKLKAKLTKNIIESISKMSDIKKVDENTENAQALQETESVPVIETETVRDPILDRKKHSIADLEFMLLRYNIDTHPITSAKLHYQNLYVILINYMLYDLRDVSPSIQIIVEEYIRILKLSADIVKPIEEALFKKQLREITKKEIIWNGFLNFRLRDYRFLLLLEVFYFRLVLNNKVEYELINDYCKLLNINEKSRKFIIEYIESFSRGNISVAEALVLNCRNTHISATVWPLHNNIAWNEIYSNLPKYNVAVCATMSSGKSTFINALLGKDYIPAKNEACTAKITSISDNDRLDSVIGIMFDINSKRTCRINLNNSLLEEWNNNDEVQKIILESNLDGIRSNKGIIVVHDTPGTNYSQNESHHDTTMEFLRSSPVNMVVYLVNAEHASTTDNKMLLKQIKTEVIDKQAAKIIFLVNKIDSFDSEKDDDIISCLEGIKNELTDYGYNEPIVIPISVNAARLFKMVLTGQPLSKKENAQFKNLFELFSSENLNLIKLSGCKNTPDIISGESDTMISVGDSCYKQADVLEALRRTGITLVEAILDKEMNN